uniref:Uncharacterized protein n=1 Tax=Anguilla anguilla TaxID=7936 RepID=A0A0E9RQ53_ANGAN
MLFHQLIAHTLHILQLCQSQKIL